MGGEYGSMGVWEYGSMGAWEYGRGGFGKGVCEKIGQTLLLNDQAFLEHGGHPKTGLNYRCRINVGR